MNELAPMINKVQQFAIEYSENVEGVMPEAGMIKSGKTYREKKAKPLLEKLIKLVRSIYAAYWMPEKSWRGCKIVTQC